MKVEEVLAQIAQQLEDYRTRAFPILKKSLEVEVEKLKSDPKLYQDTQKFVEVIHLLIIRDLTLLFVSIERNLTGADSLNPPNPAEKTNYYLRPLLRIQDNPATILQYAVKYFYSHKQELDRFPPLQNIRQMIFRTLEAVQVTIKKGIETALGTAEATRLSKGNTTVKPFALRKKQCQIIIGEYEVRQGTKTLKIPKHSVTIEVKIDDLELFSIGSFKVAKDFTYYFNWAKAGCPVLTYRNATILPEEASFPCDYKAEPCSEMILDYVLEKTEEFLKRNPQLLRSQTVHYSIVLSPKGKQERGFLGQYLPKPSTFSHPFLGINIQYFLPEILDSLHPNTLLKNMTKDFYSYTQTLAHELGHTFDVNQIKFGVESLVEAYVMLKTSDLTPISYFITWILQTLREEGLAEFSRCLYSTKRIPLVEVPRCLSSAKGRLIFNRDRPPEAILQLMENKQYMNQVHDEMYVPGLYMVALLFITRQTRAGIPTVLRETARPNAGGAILSFDKIGESLRREERLYVILEPRSICEQFLTKLSLMPLERFIADYNEACTKLKLPENQCFFPEFRPFLREVENLGRQQEEEQRKKLGPVG